MAQDRKETFSQLSRLWEDENISVLSTAESKYAILSDLHFGDGGPADDFHHNKETMKRMLTYYQEKGYSIILLGDIEELWQFDLDQVKKEYDDEIYSLFREFKNNCVIRVFGNHDREWESPPDPVMKNPEITKGAPEALKMKAGYSDPSILLVHGHQGNIESDKNSWSSKFFVRIYKVVEPWLKSINIGTHPPAIKSQITTDYEQIMYAWAKQNNVILICGHSHRAIFASTSYADRLREQIEELKLANKNDKKIDELNKKLEIEKKKNRDIDPTDPGKKPLPCYFNTGCGLFTTGITCVEIEKDEIRLVKWHNNKKKESMYEIYERGSLHEFYEQINKE